MSVPGITPGPGAGVGAAADLTVGSRDDAGILEVTTAGAPLASSAIVSLAFIEAYESAPISVAISPVNEAAAQLGQASAYVQASGISVLGFTLTSTGIPLAPGLEYQWAYTLKF